MALEIRPIEDGDSDEVVALWRLCGLTRPWNDPARDIAFCRKSAEAVLLVGREPAADRLLATVMVGHDGHRAWVYYLAVEPTAQSKGHGRAMMAAAEDWAKARGVPKLELLIRSENVDVKRFYEALGYRVEDVIVMARWLDGR